MAQFRAAIQCLAAKLPDQGDLKAIQQSVANFDLAKLIEGKRGPEDILLGAVSGDHNFHFTFRLEGSGYFQTGVLVASAHQRAGGLPLPLRCRWKRRVGDLLVEIPGVTSNMYQISADDVGTEIVVNAEPADADEGFSGVAVGTIGPFELDPSTRRSLDNALGFGSGKFFARTARAPAESGGTVSPRGQPDLAITVASDAVRVASVQSGAREVTAPYSGDYPKVIIHPLDICKFQLVLDASNTFNLLAASRTSRDLIALNIRYFHALRIMSTQDVLAQVLPTPTPGPGGLTSSAASDADDKLDACVNLDRLVKERNRAMSTVESTEKAIRNTNHEIEQLQAQLEETIAGYTVMIETIQEQCATVESAVRGDTESVFSAPSAEPHSMQVRGLQEQLAEVQKDNRDLADEVAKTRQRLAEAKEANRGGKGASPQPSAEEVKLRQERDALRAQLADMTSSSDQADQAHAMEIKRHRQDVEALHGQKEELRRVLMDADKERQELQDNFLYVKGQLDKVQVLQAQSAGSGPQEQEMAKVRQSLKDLQEERNRLNTRLEGVSREAEKEKTYHETSLERVMTANSRLMEEKDRMEVECRRVAQLYAESVRQAEPTAGTPGTLETTQATSLEATAEAIGEANAQDAELRDLKAQIAQVNETIHAREQENESLKNRIRKLAVSA